MTGRGSPAVVAADPAPPGTARCCPVRQSRSWRPAARGLSPVCFTARLA